MTRVAGIPASYSGGLEFYSQHGDRNFSDSRRPIQMNVGTEAELDNARFFSRISN
jgi:hypothetical protein